MFDYAYRVWADGGCAQNGTREARGYASYVRSNVTREKNGDPA